MNISTDILPPVNVPLLQKALDHIEAHPEDWNQGAWIQRSTVSSCGTVACLAGHIALISGWKPYTDGPDGWRGDWSSVERDGRVANVADVALAELGIRSARVLNRDPRRGEGIYRGNLWSGQNDRETLWKLANILAEGQLTLPMDLQEQ